MPAIDYDVVVIGSGFGGSVMTCRLAEMGIAVCLLERGSRYGYSGFPRHTHEGQRFFWDPDDGSYGLYDFNVFHKSDAFVACASGLGGGSLIYASVLMPAPADFFHTWPGGINRQVMDPYYDRVLEMMEASPYPAEDPCYKDSKKTAALRRAYEALAAAPEANGNPQWSYPNLGVRFHGEFPGAQSPNNQGRIQSSCNKCGECVAGCNIQAKNSLDLNYIARSENQELLGPAGKAATVITGAEAFDIVPEYEGYRVHYRNPQRPDAPAAAIACRKVAVAAGSFNSTALLLKLKDKGSLPNLSDQLGRHWCGNGDLEGSILRIPDRINPTAGPTITGAISCRFPDYDDGFAHGLTIQDGGFPAFFAWYLVGRIPSPGSVARFFDHIKRGLLRLLRSQPDNRIGDEIFSIMANDDYIQGALVLLGMGRDRSNGVIRLTSNKTVELDWQMEAGSELHFERLRDQMKKMASVLGGNFVDSPLTYCNKVIAVHPLGGCIMAESGAEGVVDINGEAFGHPGLYVVDGSILPSSTGVNPSLTIAANAERIAERFRL